MYTWVVSTALPEFSHNCMSTDHDRGKWAMLFTWGTQVRECSLNKRRLACRRRSKRYAGPCKALCCIGQMLCDILGEDWPRNSYTCRWSTFNTASTLQLGTRKERRRPQTFSGRAIAPAHDQPGCEALRKNSLSHTVHASGCAWRKAHASLQKPACLHGHSLHTLAVSSRRYTLHMAPENTPCEASTRVLVIMTDSHGRGRKAN